MMTSPGLKRGWRGFDSDIGRFDEKKNRKKRDGRYSQGT